MLSLKTLTTLAALSASAVRAQSCGDASATTAPPTTSSPPVTTAPPTSDWKFEPVRSIKARVQGNLPVWDAEHQVFVSGFGANFEEKYRGVLDTVNMASVEGAFKYVQSECINYYDVKDLKCQRKNNIQYVVFYETVVAQPRAAMAKYQRGLDNSPIEHCPYIPMDGGQCTPTNGVIPKYCDEYTGANGTSKLGFCIGGDLRDKEFLAPYPDTYWYSFPNSCPSKLWNDKTAACRASDAGGLCPFGSKPDGVNCTFSFELLGWVKLDDVIGITSMVNPKTNATYSNYTEFCQAGGIEYKVKADAVAQTLTVEETLPFWSNPSSREANSQRATKLVEAYNKQVSTSAKTSDGGVMKPLPTAAALTKANPACYKNNVLCATSQYGCRRHAFAQICEVCTEKASDCEVAPTGFKFAAI